MKYVAIAFAIAITVGSSVANAQTYKTLVRFTGTGGTANGGSPSGSLTISGTTLYGMTESGGVNSDGNVFSVGFDGTSFQNLVSFTGTSGAAWGLGATGSVTLSGTTLYGMTCYGGSNAYGTLFSVGTNGTSYRSLASFTGSTDEPSIGYPVGTPTISGSTVYGMTILGNIFSIGTNGSSFQNIHFFGSAEPSGSVTLSGTTLYGMTGAGGSTGHGGVFRVGVNGTSFQNLISFTGTSGSASGSFPFGSLLLDGTTLYGMTTNGGASGIGNVFALATTGGNFRNLVSFTSTSGSATGAHPFGSLIISGTTLYGMTQGGGTNNFGDIFSVGTDGTAFQDLYNFVGGSDGRYPMGDLTLSGGTLFGMTASGGINDKGTVFAFTLPTPTPEPGTLALVAAGTAAMALFRWRGRLKCRMAKIER